MRVDGDALKLGRGKNEEREREKKTQKGGQRENNIEGQEHKCKRAERRIEQVTERDENN